MKKLLSIVVILTVSAMLFGMFAYADSTNGFNGDANGSVITAITNGVQCVNSATDLSESKPASVTYSQKIDVTKGITLDFTPLSVNKHIDASTRAPGFIISLTKDPLLKPFASTEDALAIEMTPLGATYNDTWVNFFTNGGQYGWQNAADVGSYLQSSYQFAKDTEVTLSIEPDAVYGYVFKINGVLCNNKNSVQMPHLATLMSSLFPDGQAYLSIATTGSATGETAGFKVENLINDISSTSSTTSDTSSTSSNTSSTSSNTSSTSSNSTTASSSAATSSGPAPTNNFLLASKTGNIAPTSNGIVLKSSTTDYAFAVNTTAVDLSKAITCDLTPAAIYGCEWGSYMTPKKPDQSFSIALSDSPIGFNMGGKDDSLVWNVAPVDGQPRMAIVSFNEQLKGGGYAAIDASLSKLYPQFSIPYQAGVKMSITLDLYAAKGEELLINGKAPLDGTGKAINIDLTSFRTLFKGKQIYLTIGTSQVPTSTVDGSLKIENVINGTTVISGVANPNTGSCFPPYIILSIFGVSLAVIFVERKKYTSKG